MFGHFEPVNHCCFSPNDAYLSTSSNDGTVKVSNILSCLDSCNLLVDFETFNTKALNCLQLTDHPCLFYSFHFQYFEATHIQSLCSQLFQVASANEWKSINVRSLMMEGEEDVPIKCSTWTADGKHIICGARNAVLVSMSLCGSGSVWTCCEWIGYWSVRLVFLPVLAPQVFDVETANMLFEIRTNRLSTVQYCQACPTSNLLAIAFSNYAIEVLLS